MVPGPMSRGCPQFVSLGMSVAYLTMVVSNPGNDLRWTAGTSEEIVAVTRSSSVEKTSCFNSSKPETTRIATEAAA